MQSKYAPVNYYIVFPLYNRNFEGNPSWQNLHKLSTLRLLPLWKLKRVFFRRMLRKTYDFLWYPILEFGSVIALVAYLPKKTKTYESLGESRQFLHIQ